MTPACSIVIPVHNHAALTRQCLDTLLARPLPDAEIIVVDDGSSDETPTALAGYRDRIRVRTRAANGGFALACNDGASIARGAHLVFLNNDTIPRDGWLDALTRYADAHPNAAVVGSKLVFPNDTIQHAGVVICQDRVPRHVYAGFPADHPAVNRSRRFQVVTAACMLVRHEEFAAAGGFDTAFMNGYEDVDLCLRLGERGGEIHYCHESELVHLESASRGFRHREGARLYEQRWASRVQPDDLACYEADGLLTVAYAETYPIELTASPLLATVRVGAGDSLLAVRSRQVFHLLRETIRLFNRVVEAAVPGAVAMASPTWSEPRPSKPALPPDFAADASAVRALLLDAHQQLVERDDEIQRELDELRSRVRLVLGAEADNGLGDDIGYEPLTRRVRAVVASVVPRGSRVIVVSRGDAALLHVDGCEAVHFPCNEDGSYSGYYPADSDAAIAQLEWLRARGGAFFVVPKPAFWWLEHYAGLRAHLEQRYRTIARVEDTCVIVSLGDSASGAES